MLQGVLDRVRRPEYTGENRCLPCTATNLGIAAVVTAVLAVLVPPVAVVFAAVALGSIWLRGYLVPGTPELTKRYFPEWLLAKFDKAPANPEPISPEEFDPETVLLDSGAVEPCAGDDLCLTADFERAWRSRIEALSDDETLRTELAEQLGLDAAEVTFESHGDAYLARDGTNRIGQWESRSALLADLAAATELPKWVEWDRLGARARSQLLSGLRVFVETCPSCGGLVTADTETVESCCRSHTVVAVGCESCGDRLLEVPYNEAAA